ncbi:MAG: hypothetical protein ACOX4N_07380 [Dethiobacteraceae bacterium]
MDNVDRETTQKIMDLFSRFWRLHRACPIPGIKHSEMRILFGVKKSLKVHGCGARISDLSRGMRVTSLRLRSWSTAWKAVVWWSALQIPRDRRSIRVILTKKGEETLQTAADAFFRIPWFSKTFR